MVIPEHQLKKKKKKVIKYLLYKVEAAMLLVVPKI